MLKIALKIDQQYDFVYGALANKAAQERIPYLIVAESCQIEVINKNLSI